MKVLMSGLPGKMAQAAATALNDAGIALHDFGLSSDRHDGELFTLSSNHIRLIGRTKWLASCDKLPDRSETIVVDYSKPDIALANIEFFCQAKLPFVTGTTGFNRDQAVNLVRESEISAVIAPNMGIPLVVLQSLLEQATAQFPHAFNGYTLEVVESHQHTKVDASGFGTLLSNLFKRLGAKLPAKNFVSIRDQARQRQMGIPEEALSGHGYHTYSLRADDGASEIILTHNVRGRALYGTGTVEAVRFLAEKIAQGNRGESFSMVDVLRGTIT